MVHKISFPEWDDIKQNVSRTPQILKQKANIGTHTVDEEFEKLYDVFCEISGNIGQLGKNVIAFNEAIRALISYSVDVGKSFQEISEPNLKNFSKKELTSKVSAREFEAADSLMLELKRYLEIHLESDQGVTEILDMMRNFVESKLNILSPLLKNVRKYVKERNYALLDYDECCDTIDSLEFKVNGLSTKQHQSLFAHKRRLEDYKARYNILNSTFKKELPYLFMLVREISKPLFIEIYFCQLSVYHLLSTRFNDVSRNSKLEFYSDFEQVKDKMLSKQEPVLKILESLKICDFRDTFLKNLTSNISSPSTSKSPVLSEPNEYTQQAEYCKALFHFVKIQDEDLSFQKGDIIKIISKTSESSEQWWKGEINGIIGTFPSNYVKLIS